LNSADSAEYKTKPETKHRGSAVATQRQIAPRIVSDVLRSPGQSLDRTARGFMETRFGADFSDVRVHTDAKAAESARAVNALAYTVGSDIVFDQGQYAPNRESGRKVLAHELVHTMQQGSARSLNAVQSVVPSHPSSLPASAQRKFTPGQALQRFSCDQGTAAITCDDAQGTGHPAGVDLEHFGENGRALKPEHQLIIDRFVKDWVAAGSKDDVEVHGFASCDGDADFNLQLSCDRAEAASRLLAKKGITTSITSVAHGETDEFGSVLEDNRRAILTTIVRPPQTATIPAIRGSSTPSAMTGDRLPPRVDTPISMVLGGASNPALPVVLSVDGTGGGNGTATINGGATQTLTASGTVNLQGVDQTDPGKSGGLTLVARRGGAVLASSKGFSVSAIPQNFSFTFSGLITRPFERGILVNEHWESDSGVLSDLDEAEVAERVEITTDTGACKGVGQRSGCYAPAFTILGSADEHSFPIIKSECTRIVNQTHMFKDHRAGAADVPMTNSGFLITRILEKKPRSGAFFPDFQITTKKEGATTTANDSNPTCSSAPIASAAGSGSVTKTQDM
jgi:outer membrane protein OmpA-like peptidoglycan-associated protein